MASLSLSRLIKSRSPNTKTVISTGASEGVMGAEISKLPFLDYVCTGRSYEVLPEMLRALNHGELPQGSPYLVGPTRNRDHKDVCFSGKRLSLPRPQFEDYFGLGAEMCPGGFDTVPLETSKGCWWAEKRQCSFCGLNGDSLLFREKSPDDALLEIQQAVRLYNINRIEMNDVIIPHRYFEDFFERLASMELGVSIFYETKAHLKLDKLKLLKDAGVSTVQAGIESLSDRTLKSMSKGIDAARNVEFLRDCAALGIKCYWNYLHSFPGETAACINEALPFVNSAVDCDPPSTFQPVRVERFSPFFNKPEMFGISEILPNKNYYHLYSGSDLDIGKLAFYHSHKEEGEHVHGRSAAVRRLQQAVTKWQQANITH